MNQHLAEAPQQPENEAANEGFEGCIQQPATCKAAGVCLGPRSCPNSPMRIVPFPRPEETEFVGPGGLALHLGEACLQQIDTSAVKL